MYVYTKKGEKYSEEHGIHDRKSGEVVYYGCNPIENGPVARAWLASGYIQEGE